MLALSVKAVCTQKISRNMELILEVQLVCFLIMIEFERGVYYGKS
jgi:hypothetical protein